MNPPLETKGGHPQEEEKKELMETRREPKMVLIVQMNPLAPVETTRMSRLNDRDAKTAQKTHKNGE
jgi:hypothetical protein